jgi:D-beta-D-heptose 7-phosphate kinase/D-beta-D-heptose 1-phosphate adenosyltransferase
VDKLNPEAPVPLFKLSHCATKQGMVENVENNLRNLDCEVSLYHGTASIKQRFIDIRSGQQIMRFDHDTASVPLTVNNIKKLDWDDSDAVVISDYNKGFVSTELITHIAQCFTGPVFIDTKKTNFSSFGSAFVKINELESTKATALTESTIVTLGSKGARFQSVVYPAPAVTVVDVTGAGDTFIAALTVSYLETGNISNAIKFAILAASVSVQFSGVYAPTRKQIV